MAGFNALKAKEEELLCRTYGRYPVSVHKAQGSYLWDMEDKQYLDLLAGIAVTSLGHCHQEINQVIIEQCQKLIHVSNLFYQEEQLELAERLLATCHMEKVFFCNSGAEANEAGIKIARRYQQRIKNRQAYEIITLEHAFHGRTLATLTATGQEKYLDGFTPSVQGFKKVAWNDIEALEQAITPQTAGVLMEIVQGEGGIHCLSAEYLEQVQALCRKHEILFIVDEVQTGLCRTGKWWAFQHFNIKPDIITSAKALANGLPLGAMLTTNEISQAFQPGSHATTFGGGALVTKVGAKVLEIMERDNLAEHATQMGAYLQEKIEAWQSPYIKEVRGLGLMRGIQLSCSEEKAKKLWTELIEHGIIVNLTQGTVLRLLPALNITQKELDTFLDVLKKLLLTI